MSTAEKVILLLLAVITCGLTFVFFTTPAKAAGCAPFLVASGGTGNCTFTGGSVLYGNGTGKLGAVATSTITNGTGISFTGTPGALVGGTALTITNSGVTSIVAGTNISISGATGAVTVTGIGYPFPSNATSTLLTFNGGATIANTLTLSGITGTNNNCLQVSTTGVVSGTGSACGGSGSSFAYPFPNNATSTLITFNAGAIISTSTTGTLNAGSVSASSTLILPLITSKTLNTDANGLVYGTGTSTPTVTSPITYSGTLGSFIGGVSGAFACATCNTSNATVSSVAISAPAIFTVSGSPVTTTGTLTLSYSGTALPIANGGTNATSFTTSNNSVYYTGSALATAATTQAVTTPYASTTALTASGAVYIPQSASSTLAATGQIAVQTGTASSSIQYQDGTRQAGLYNLTPRTVSIVNPAGSAATTTIPIAISGRGLTLTEGFCQSAGGGSFTGVIGNGTATTTYLQSSNAGGNPTVTALTLSNTFHAYKTAYVQFGSWSQSTATTSATCSWSGYFPY